MRPVAIAATLLVMGTLALFLVQHAGVVSSHGLIATNEAFTIHLMTRVANGEQGWTAQDLRELGSFSHQSLLGFQLVRTSAWRRGRTYLVMPPWVLPLLALLCGSIVLRGAAAMASRFRRGGGRPHEGFCPCGYDLRGSPDRCPECGLAVRQHPERSK